MAAYYISFVYFILILNILQHIYGIMASVLDTIIFGIVPKVPFPEGICWGATPLLSSVHKVRDEL